MKLIDEKGRLGGKVHLFDLLVIAALVIGLGAMGFRFIQSRTMSKEYKNAEYTLEIQGVREFAWDSFKAGETIYENKVPLGTILNVEVLPYKTTELLADGSSAQVEHVLYKSIKLTVKTDRLIRQKGYFIETQEFLNGTRHNISNGYITCEAIVRELRVQE